MEERVNQVVDSVKTTSLASKRERMMTGLLMPRRSKSTSETNLMT